MYTFFYSNISEFVGDLEGMIDEGTYKTSIQNMHKLGCKADYFKYTDASMLCHGCGFLQYTKIYEKTKIYIKCYYVHMWESIQVKRVTNFLQESWIITLARSIETLVMESTSYIKQV